jgi:NADH:ubiquinone oxidoreductase subunit 6 (subunit J)
MPVMRPGQPLASGDPVLFLLIAGVLVLVGAAIGMGVAGIMMLWGKSEEKKKRGRRLLAIAAIPVALAVGAWIAVVGFD